MPANLNTIKDNKFSATCDHCGTKVWKSRISNKKKRNQKHFFCSRLCKTTSTRKMQQVSCVYCLALFSKHLSQVIRSTNHFCSRSCAVSYNNQHKTKGTRISKLEVWLRQQLTARYPTLEIHYNRKDVINSELDIYIPSLKLAFELNGIFHYEPIYGEEKLSQIQNNDTRKFAACHGAGISLCVIDTSTQKYFKPATSQKFLDIIVQHITTTSTFSMSRSTV